MTPRTLPQLTALADAERVPTTDSADGRWRFCEFGGTTYYARLDDTAAAS